ncbi:alpha-tocopherol transfer protein-like isoform X2 [Tenebrio molitor]|uniref:alpha-tocopherol transfer protein-like isoform X2 n=1 Tax=Tenebrio molitor TaxID=7067 RepID=UPI0036247A39
MDSLLITTAEEKNQILKLYNIGEAEIKEDVNLIKAWIVKQPHLPQNLSDDCIEKVLLRNKCRVERTKQKLDNYYSLRGHNRDLIRDFENVVPSEHVSTYLPMPKLTPKLERILIMKILKPEAELYDIMEVIKINLATTELLFKYDDSVGVRYLYDFQGFTLRHMARMNPVPIIKQISMIEKGYSCRMLGVDLVNFPSFASKIMALLKMLLRPKIYERVKIHPNLESVYEVMPKDCLPSEYGGTYSTIPKLTIYF